MVDEDTATQDEPTAGVVGIDSDRLDFMEQPGLFEAPPADEEIEADPTPVFDPPPGLRDESRSRRVRSLLCTAPLHELQSGRASRGGIFPDLDCYDLALGAIDFVVDRMGFDTGAQPEEVIVHLFGEIIDWVPAANEDDVEAAARTINEVLIRPQRGTYSDPDDPTRRPFDLGAALLK